ncbi:hypothetical protein [uncultured Paludibaculum sp.]|uniref:hypothetical protein n=1 Tax=uncultured Paludibaculum sp. TaxID=1765020 RepID=UPI002AAADB25|nr:hypothetical protein [uncultured Paludibaculum sp.]
MRGEIGSSDSATTITWLSGRILTFFDKLVLPVIWFGCLTCVPLWVYLQTGHISISREFYFIVAFTIVVTVLLAWFTVRLQLVGYLGQELVIANYWREARIPFELVDAVESVWWYKGRLVRIRFRTATPFGEVVYYLPKWAPLRTMFSHPEEDLRAVLRATD